MEAFIEPIGDVVWVLEFEVGIGMDVVEVQLFFARFCFNAIEGTLYSHEDESGVETGWEERSEGIFFSSCSIINGLSNFLKYIFDVRGVPFLGRMTIC
ncbi:uncharacterized protein BXIN_1607 [Babesia sp. Xinjiang]|uniref:uncharacterized protein n=1 Tax=Babesia sp. Xinjiang TaxID=462227 RepID=UPI000A232000|nr:uncharacterized protein BXIN_1607 [Babesia sp. Xinjiang]ORM42170.1 hypothetical protein BXIN_1607 [Babesia sp. Xinjiang]